MPSEIEKTDPLAEALEDEFTTITASFEDMRGPSDSDLEWYARIRAKIAEDRMVVDARRDYELAQILANYDAICKVLDRQEEALDQSWPGHVSPGEMARQFVSERIKTTKQRYVQTIHGRVGFRRKPAKDRREITDNDAAIAWAEENCPEAVTTKATKSIAKSKLPFDCPYIEIRTTPAVDEFYFAPAKLELPAPETPALPAATEQETE